MNTIIDGLIEKGKSIGFDQKSLASKIGMSGESFSRAKKRGNLKLNDLQSLAAAVGAEITYIDKRDIKPTNTRERIEDIGLTFPYDWSKGEMSDELIIKKVLERFIFKDVVLICCHFGIDFIENIHKTLNPSPEQHEIDTLMSIRKGIHEQ